MKIVSYDLETTISKGPHGPAAKDPENNIATVIWGDHPDNIKLWHNFSGKYRYLPPEAHNDILDADVLVGTNLPFDLAYIINYFLVDEYDGTTLIRKRKLPRTWDCQIAAYLLSGQRWANPSLAELQEVYLGLKTKEVRISRLYKTRKVKRFNKKINKVENITAGGIGADKIIAAKERCPRLFRLYEKYSLEDGRTPLLIFKEQYRIAKERGMLNIIWLYNAYMVALVVIMATGIKVDLIAVEKAIRDCNLKAIEKQEEALKIVSKYWKDERLPPFLVSSAVHKSALLFGGNINCIVKKEVGTLKNGNPRLKNCHEMVFVRGFGLSPPSFSTEGKKEGQYGTGEEVIKKILLTASSDEIKQYCTLQLEAMGWKKMISTYLKPLIKFNVGSYIYPHYNNTQVITGRLSSKSPNLQNQPAKGFEGHLIQSKFVAPPGWFCVSIDYSQLEMFIAAMNSRDDELIKDLLNGLDFHCQSLAFARNLPYEEVFHKCKVEKNPEWCALRTKAKGITFQKEYGAGIKTVARDTGLSEELVDAVFEALDKKYWKLKLFKDYVMEQAVANRTYSLAKYLPEAQKKFSTGGRRFNGEYELLPIYSGKEIIGYTKEKRYVGYYQTPYGKVYSFQEYANYDKQGNLRRNFLPPQTKNYTSQGGAADVMACATVETIKYILNHQDEVKFINQIHDSFWLYIKDNKNKSSHISKICDIMENIAKPLKKYLNIDLPFKFQVEAKVGANFSEMEVYEHV